MSLRSSYGTPSQEHVKRSRAVEERDEVFRHAIDRGVGANAEPAPPIGANVAHDTDGQRSDVRVEMRMVEARRVQSQPEDLLGGNLDAAIQRGPIGGAQIPFEQIAIGVIVEAVVLVMMAPCERGGQRA